MGVHVAVGVHRLQLRMNSNGVHVQVLKCGVELAAEGPPKAYGIAAGVKRILGAEAVRWSSRGVPLPESVHLQAYYDMMADAEEPKELLAEYNSRLSSAAIWRIAG